MKLFVIVFLAIIALAAAADGSSSVGSALSSIPDKIESAVSSIVWSIQEGISTVVQAATGVFGAFKDVISQLIEALRGIYQSIFS